VTRQSPALLWVDDELRSIVHEQFLGEEGTRGCARRNDLLAAFLAILHLVTSGKQRIPCDISVCLAIVLVAVSLFPMYSLIRFPLLGHY
jgi:hypothetical protein